jgi:hypothetical protein
MKIKKWRCDICEKEFEEGDGGFDASLPVLIEIPNIMGNNDKFEFEDTCSKCRESISSFLRSLESE